MKEYKGSCHCGAVKFSYTGEPIEKGLRCNCSICSRKGAMMSSEVIPLEKLKIDAEEGALGLYQFGAKTAKHHFCRQCGIYTFHETARFPGHYRVNLGCIEGIDTLALEADLFDGKHLL
ncbi:MAG: GFA family protein [Sedimenticola sp.]